MQSASLMSARSAPVARTTRASRTRAVRVQALSRADVAATVAGLKENAGKALAASALSLVLATGGASAKLEGVNKPELLPAGEKTAVIDVAGFLTNGEETRIKNEVAALEDATGLKLRVLAQNYPDTPGLAIKEYWGVDDNTVVFVADPTFGQILNFSVGTNVDLEVPPSFWTRLAGKYGNKFYWQENGENTSILNAVSAIDSCLREEPGRLKCSKVQGDFGEQASSGPFGKKFFGQ